MADVTEAGPGWMRIRAAIRPLRLPPSFDALLVGCSAPVGAEAVRRTLEATAPGKFAVIPVRDDGLEAIAIRKGWLRRLPEAGLVRFLRGQWAAAGDEDEVLAVWLHWEVRRQSVLPLNHAAQTSGGSRGAANPALPDDPKR